MSSDGVILQHRTKLIAHLFVDRSDNLLIGNHIKLSHGVNVWNNGRKNCERAYPDRLSGGKVFVEGEYWSATSDTFLNKGEPVQIIAVEGLTVKVKPET